MQSLKLLYFQQDDETMKLVWLDRHFIHEK